MKKVFAILPLVALMTACQSMKPAIDQIAKSGIQVAKIDTDYDVSLTEQYKVKSIPTVVMLENG